MKIRNVLGFTFATVAIGISLNLTGCSSKEEKEATVKANADVARIRELKELEEARIKKAAEFGDKYNAEQRKLAAELNKKYNVKPSGN